MTSIHGYSTGITTVTHVTRQLWLQLPTAKLSKSFVTRQESKAELAIYPLSTRKIRKLRSFS